MANWLHQLQSLLGQQGASPSGESSKGSGLLPGAIGGLAGLLVASKSSRKLLAKYGTSALLAGTKVMLLGSGELGKEVAIECQR
ncbi:hypothetical protein RUW46_24370, partial [Klebsiella pneumoniae]|nr:hypothetical protein [Klebsiella pneumoniae]